MTKYEVLTFIVSLTAVLIIPMFVLMFRITAKWTTTELRLETLGKQMADLVTNKDKVHEAMFSQMREDRQATNARLEWLEHNLWNDYRNRDRPGGVK